MASKKNYDNTRELAENLSGIVGISKRLIIHFTRILSLGYVTQIASQALKCEDGKIKNTRIFIPFVGVLNIKFQNGEIIDTDFVIDSKFKRQVTNAVNTGETDLITDLEKSLIKSIQDKYNSII